VTSGDEFEELGISFNAMAARLGQQFNSLSTIADVQQAILTSFDRSRILGAVVERLPDLIDAQTAGAAVIESGLARTWVLDPDGALVACGDPCAPDGLDELGPACECHVVDAREALPAALVPVATRGVRQIALLPFQLDERLSVVIAVGRVSRSPLDAVAVTRVRRLGDQMMIGLANARLINELEHFSWGTLSALARAIDAKSPWTSGHSERVAHLSVEIGKRLGLPEEELRSLRRGALLHDIGKIGSPAAILDKPERLTDAEFSQMKDHVRVGAMILEPIAAFADALPVVLEHHERLDGKGYPNGLAGEAISLHARIVAVADCFDAIRSDRPYRPGMPEPRVLAILRREAGTRLDPDAVAALHHVLADEELSPPPVEDEDTASLAPRRETRSFE
jgi:putative nucleotidyltransferase with HDIG domain